MVCDVNYNVGQLACNLSLKIKKKIKNMYGLSVRIFCIPTFNKFYYLCNKFLFYIILFIVISHRKKKTLRILQVCYLSHVMTSFTQFALITTIIILTRVKIYGPKSKTNLVKIQPPPLAHVSNQTKVIC